jgi:hypothetical protein
MATDNTFGAAGTDLSQLPQGALGALGGSDTLQRAFDLANIMTPKAQEFDPALAALLYFTEMGKQASQPGATLLGSVVGSGQAPAAYMMQLEQDKREREAGIGKTAIGLAGALKPKTGPPTTVEMGPATDAQGNPELDKDGKPMFEYAVFGPDGVKQSTFNAPRKGGGVNITTGEGSPFGVTLGKKRAEEFSSQLAASGAADDSLNTMQNLYAILDTEGFKSGGLTEALLPLRRLAISFGIATGEEVDAVANLEAFQAMSQKIVLGALAQLKGALSEKELNFIQELSPGLNKTPEGNRLLLLLTMQQLEKGKRFAPFRLQWENDNENVTSENAYARLLADFKKADFMQENPYQYIQRLQTNDLEQRLTDAGASRGDDGNWTGIDTSEMAAIAQASEKRFNMPYIRKTFANSSFGRELME